MIGPAEIMAAITRKCRKCGTEGVMGRCPNCGASEDEKGKILVRPLVWIGTISTTRDQGLFHLVATEEHQGVEVARPACGARAFALTGSYPATGPIPGHKCMRCEKIERRETK